MRRWGRYATANGALAIAAAIEIAGVGLQLWVLVTCGFLLGGLGQVVKLCADTAIQIDVDDALRGHVFAVQDSVFWVAFLVAITVAACVIPADGHSPALVVAGGVVYLVRPRRTLPSSGARRIVKVRGWPTFRRLSTTCAPKATSSMRWSRRWPMTAGARRRPPRAGRSPTRSGICCGPTAARWCRSPTRTAFADVVKTALDDPIGFVNTAADELAAVAPAELLADWRATRAQLHDALLTVDDGRKLPWFGPPMSGASMATARLMETWAHGLDVADALGVTPARDRPAAIHRPHRRADP